MATIAATIIVLTSLIVANYTRLHRGIITKIVARITTLGYSIPGAAIAIAVITIFIFLDDVIIIFQQSLNMEPFLYLKQVWLC